MTSKLRGTKGNLATWYCIDRIYQIGEKQNPTKADIIHV